MSLDSGATEFYIGNATEYTVEHALSDGPYAFWVAAVDKTGNKGTAASLVFICDTTSPITSSVTASGVSTSSVVITWTTNEAATSQVEYGITSDYGSSSAVDNTLVTSHAVSLTGLPTDTAYHYRVKSTDPCGNEAVSADYTFATPDTTAPTIAEVSALDVAESGVTVSWTTNEPATSQVDYGLTSAYGSSTTQHDNLVTSHSVGLSALQPATTYHYRVRSRDSSGNVGESGDCTFTTSKPTKEVSGLISEDTTWTSDCTYVVTANVGVGQGATLVIEPGTTVRFNPDCYLKAMGMLKAIGTAEAGITFTCNSSSPAPYQWNGIRFSAESVDASFDGDGNYIDGSTIQFATIEYAAYPAIYILDDSPFIYQCLIQNNGVGIKIHGAEGYLSGFAHPVVKRCTFKNNGAMVYGLALETRGPIAPTVLHNTIYGTVEIADCSGTFLYNLIQSSDTAIWIWVNQYVSPPTVSYNTILGTANMSGQVGAMFSYNNLSKGDSDYAFANGGERDISTLNNWWGTTDTAIIDSLIYDHYDNFELGQVMYQPIATNPIPEAP